MSADLVVSMAVGMVLLIGCVLFLTTRLQSAQAGVKRSARVLFSRRLRNREAFEWDEWIRHRFPELEKRRGAHRRLSHIAKIIRIPIPSLRPEDKLRELAEQSVPIDDPGSPGEATSGGSEPEGAVTVDFFSEAFLECLEQWGDPEDQGLPEELEAALWSEEDEFISALLELSLADFIGALVPRRRK